MNAAIPTGALRARAILGRTEVLERLDALLAESASEGRVVAIAGDAGLGKTRLVTALLARARERGRLVMVGRASPLAVALPLGVVQDALREERRARPAPPPDDPLAAAFPGYLLPELATPAGARELDRGALFEAAARYLRTRSELTGLVVVLEDLHWADATSHALVASLARTTHDAAILLAVTYRTDEAPAGSSLDLLRHELTRERLVEELRLAPLASEDVARMLRDIVGLELAEEIRAMVARASGGNPFVVEELVRDAVSAGRLDPSEGRWRLDEPIVLPGTVQDMLLRRVRALTPSDRELLRWAAVLGERFDADLLAAAAGEESDAALAALGRLNVAGLVAGDREAGAARLAFRHSLTREAVLGDLLGPDRRRRHARVLEVAEAAGGAEERLGLEAALEHALGAEDRALGLELSVRAGRRAIGLGGFTEARAHYERALALWAPEDGRALRADLLMRLGYLTSHVGGGLQMWHIRPRSREHFEEARGLYEAIGDVTSAALALAGAVWSLERTDVVDELRRARDQLGPATSVDAICQVLSRLADREFLAGETREALRTCAAGLALLDGVRGEEDPAGFPGRARLRRSLLLTAAVARIWLGDAEGGRAAILALADEALEVNDDLWAALAFHYLARASADRPAEAAAHAERAGRLTARLGLRPMTSWLAHLRAQALMHGGKWGACAELLDAAEVFPGGVPDHPFVSDALHMVRGELALARGAHEEAIALLGAVVPVLDDRHGRIFRRVARTGLARARLTLRDAEGAWEALAPLLAGWCREDEGPFALSALLPMVAVEVAAARGDAGEAERWSAELAALGAGPRADYAQALSGFAGGRTGWGPPIAEAAGAVEGDGRRWEGAWMLLAGAEAGLRAGDAEAGGDLAGAALERFRAMDADGWSALAEAALRRAGRRVPGRRTRAGPGGLTEREREVLRLIVEGMSNRAIAERLVIAEGTAGRHVSNVFAKIGAHSRLEAARIAAERGLLGDPEAV